MDSIWGRGYIQSGYGESFLHDFYFVRIGCEIDAGKLRCEGLDAEKLTGSDKESWKKMFSSLFWAVSHFKNQK